MGRAKSISLLWDITKIVNTTTSPEQVFSDVARECAMAMKLDKIVIYSYNGSEEHLVQKAVFGYKNIDFSNDQFNKVGNDRREIDSASSIMINKYLQLSVPIIWKGKLYGQIDSHFSTQTFDNESSKLLFAIIASLLAPKFVELYNSKRVFKSDNKYYTHFLKLLEEEKLYRDENLSLGDVSKKLNVSSSYLSQIINMLGNKSFSALVNEYRINEVTDAFKSGRHLRYSILAIAFDAGFSSKSTFNAVFKSELGCTPSKYIQKYV